MDSKFNLLNSFSDSIAIIDSNGVIIFTNNSWNQFSLENSGIPTKTNEGVNYLEVCDSVNDDDSSPKRAANGILKVINGKLNIFEMEYPCHSKNEKRWFILRAAPLKVTGPTNLILVSHINITGRKIAEELVEKKNSQLSEINLRLNSSMYKIAHDIQGPLNSIIGLVNLSKTEKNSIDIKNILNLVEKSTLNLKGFIQETLSLSSLENKNESILFKTILEEYYESIKYSKILKTVSIEFETVQTMEFISNKSNILSVISNLINNSLKYYDPLKKKPFVSVTINVSKEGAKISVKDNGLGISPEFLPKIFERNFQVAKGKSTGAGIGLYMVRETVDSLKGQIGIESRIGEGTKITVFIPYLHK